MKQIDISYNKYRVVAIALAHWRDHLTCFYLYGAYECCNIYIFLMWLELIQFAAMGMLLYAYNLFMARLGLLWK